MAQKTMAYEMGFADACDGKPINVHHMHNSEYLAGYTAGGPDAMEDQ